EAGLISINRKRFIVKDVKLEIADFYFNVERKPSEFKKDFGDFSIVEVRQGTKGWDGSDEVVYPFSSNNLGYLYNWLPVYVDLKEPYIGKGQGPEPTEWFIVDYLDNLRQPPDDEFVSIFVNKYGSTVPEIVKWRDQILEGGDAVKLVSLPLFDSNHKSLPSSETRFFVGKVDINLKRYLVVDLNDPQNSGEKYGSYNGKFIVEDKSDLVNFAKVIISINEDGSSVKSLVWRSLNEFEDPVWFVDYLNDQGQLRSLRATAPNTDRTLYGDNVPGDFKLRGLFMPFDLYLGLKELVKALDQVDDYTNVVAFVEDENGVRNIVYDSRVTYSGDKGEVDDDSEKEAMISAIVNAYNLQFRSPGGSQ
ncbi:MAG: hypothetical protein IH948_08390, partial [Bacteroidetes bacterium]|nr:hypothetical protein [Bacteroidota bacterium]